MNSLSLVYSITELWYIHGRCFLPPQTRTWIQEGEKEQTSWGPGLRPETICLRPTVSDFSLPVSTGRTAEGEWAWIRGLRLTPREAHWRVGTAVCQIELGALKLKIHIYLNRSGCLEGDEREGRWNITN